MKRISSNIILVLLFLLTGHTYGSNDADKTNACGGNLPVGKLIETLTNNSIVVKAKEEKIPVDYKRYSGLQQIFWDDTGEKLIMSYAPEVYAVFGKSPLDKNIVIINVYYNRMSGSAVEIGNIKGKIVQVYFKKDHAVLTALEKENTFRTYVYGYGKKTAKKQFWNEKVKAEVTIKNGMVNPDFKGCIELKNGSKPVLYNITRNKPVWIEKNIIGIVLRDDKNDSLHSSVFWYDTINKQLYCLDKKIFSENGVTILRFSSLRKEMILRVCKGKFCAEYPQIIKFD